MFKKGIEKLERMHPSTPDFSVVYNHLDLMLDLPWETYTEDHYDLKKPKRHWILTIMACIKLKREFWNISQC